MDSRVLTVALLGLLVVGALAIGRLTARELATGGYRIPEDEADHPTRPSWWVAPLLAVLALVAAVGLVVTVVTAYFTMPDSAGGSYDELLGRSAQDTGFTAWFWTAAVASVVAVVPAALAVRLTPTWPEMGSRYDAPTGAASTAPETVETDLDLWHALDDGRDVAATMHKYLKAKAASARVAA